MKAIRHYLLIFTLLLTISTPLLSKETGIASWYISDIIGALTANGEIYDEQSSNAAHKSLPFGSLIEVLNVENGKKTIVRINDRGPFVEGRIIDLTPYSAKQLGMYEQGITKVELKEIYIPVSVPAYSNPFLFGSSRTTLVKCSLLMPLVILVHVCP
mgnify:CR=1 FL=1